MIQLDSLLRSHDLRLTEPRRLVLEVLSKATKPLKHKEIHQKIERAGAALNLVTVYRMLETFAELGIIHKHPGTEGFVLCSLQEQSGHHGFLTCRDCGTVEEFMDKKLCKEEHRIAKKAGFHNIAHMTNIVGNCTACCS